MYWSSSCRPCALTKCEPVMPSRCASAFMRAAKAVLRAADAFADRHGDVVGRLDHASSSARCRASAPSPACSPSCSAARWRHCLDMRDRRMQRELAGLDRAEGHIGGHQLGERGRIPALRRHPRLDDLAGRWVEQDRRIGRRRPTAARERQRRQTTAPRESYAACIDPKSPLAVAALSSVSSRHGNAPERARPALVIRTRIVAGAI